jgi:CRP-like cAMP-binding protein
MVGVFESILSEGRHELVMENRYLYFRGDTANCFYIVIKGRVDVTIIDYDGKEIILDTVNEGGYLGEVDLFSSGLRSCNAYAHKNTELVALSKYSVQELLQKQPKVAYLLIENLCSLIDSNIEFIQDTVLLTAYEKVSKKIHDLSKRHNKKKFATNQTEIAKMLFLSRPVTNQCFKKLCIEGIIAYKKNQVEILNETLLAQQYIKL